MEPNFSLFLLAVILLSSVPVNTQTQYEYLLTVALARIVQQQGKDACEARLTSIRDYGRIDLENALRQAKESTKRDLEACRLQTQQALDNINCAEKITNAVTEATTTANQTLTADLEECNQACATLTVTKVNEAIASVSTVEFDNCVHNSCESPSTIQDIPGCRTCIELNPTDCASNPTCQFFVLPLFSFCSVATPP